MTRFRRGTNPSKSMATLFGFAAFDFARLFVVPTVAQFLEGTLLVEFLLQPTQCAIDDLAFLDADFRFHGFHPLSYGSVLSDYFNNIIRKNVFFNSLMSEKQNFYEFFLNLRQLCSCC